MPDNTDADVPEWLTVGSQVAEYTNLPMVRVVLSTVERLTATQIVLLNGNRYRRDKLTPVGAQQNDWGRRVSLRAATDPAVVQALTRERVESAWYRLTVVINAEVRHRPVSAAEEMLTALARIEEAVAAARASIEAITTTTPEEQ